MTCSRTTWALVGLGLMLAWGCSGGDGGGTDDVAPGTDAVLDSQGGADSAVDAADATGNDASLDVPVGVDTTPDVPVAVDTTPDVPVAVDTTPDVPVAVDTAEADEVEPDVGPEACVSPSFESERCGRCGKHGRECVDGVWGEWSPCGGESGECDPGTTKPCDNGLEQKCSEDSCMWTGCTCAGPTSQTCACEEGTGTQTRVCQGETWGEWSPCACTLTTATTYVDISAGQGANSGWYPSAAIDAANQKLLVVTANRAQYSKPWLFRCNLDGTGCTSVDLGGDSNSGTESSLAIDPQLGKILVVSQYDNISWDLPTGKPMLFRCNLDGTGCTQNLVSVINYSGWYPHVTFVDGVVPTLLAAAVQGGNDVFKPVLHVCDRYGACSYNDISAGQANGSGAFPVVVGDTANGKALVITQNDANGGRPSLFRCNLDGTSCTHTDISAGQGNGTGHDPGAVIDTTNAKLLVTSGGSLFRCNLDGTGCEHRDISAGQPAGYTVRPVIDTVHDKLLVVSTDGMNKPSLVRCELDGTGCAHSDISAGHGYQSGLQVAPVFDASHNRLLVVTLDGANDWKPALFLTDL